MVFSILRLFFVVVFRLVFRWRISGLENVPASGGVIIAANHISLWDPPVIGCALPLSRRIHFMAKEELFRNPVFGWIITRLNAYPVRRGAADRNAIRTTLNLLENGEAVGIFPEGTRSKTGELGKPEAGLAMMAVKAKVPVVPAAVVGTNMVFSKGHFIPQFRVRFGPPIVLPAGRTDKENIEYLNITMMEEIARLLAEERG